MPVVTAPAASRVLTDSGERSVRPVRIDTGFDGQRQRRAALAVECVTREHLVRSRNERCRAAHARRRRAAPCCRERLQSTGRPRHRVRSTRTPRSRSCRNAVGVSRFPRTGRERPPCGEQVARRAQGVPLGDRTNRCAVVPGAGGDQALDSVQLDRKAAPLEQIQHVTAASARGDRDGRSVISDAWRSSDWRRVRASPRCSSSALSRRKA